MTTTTKNCPKCGAIHTKPGKFCSRACANSRQWTDEHKKIFSDRQREYMASDQSEEHRAKKELQTKLLSKAGVLGRAKTIDIDQLDRDEVLTNPDEYFIITPRTEFDGKYVEDGDLWEEI